MKEITDAAINLVNIKSELDDCIATHNVKLAKLESEYKRTQQILGNQMAQADLHVPAFIKLTDKVGLLVILQGGSVSYMEIRYE